MGVALTGVAVPDTQRTTFALGPNEVEMGVGIHGEPGHSRERFSNADTIVRYLSETILNDTNQSTDRALLLVNGLGGTPPAELYLAYNSALHIMSEYGLRVERSLVGTYATSLDMQGLSITLAFLTDEELSLWDSPVATAALRWRC
jgi:dihydroxyacetone kinase-like protein